MKHTIFCRCGVVSALQPNISKTRWIQQWHKWRLDLVPHITSVCMCCVFCLACELRDIPYQTQHYKANEPSLTPGESTQDAFAPSRLMFGKAPQLGLTDSDMASALLGLASTATVPGKPSWKLGSSNGGPSSSLQTSALVEEVIVFIHTRALAYETYSVGNHSSLTMASGLAGFR